MALLEVQQTTRNNLTQIVFQDVDMNDSFQADWFLNTGKECVIFKAKREMSATPIAMVYPLLIDGNLGVADRQILIFENDTDPAPAGSTAFFGPFPPSEWNDDDGFVFWQYLAGLAHDDDLQVAVIRIK